MDYHKYGGAVLLGLKKIVVKAHGSAKAKAICPAVLKAADACRNKLTEDIEGRLALLDPNVLAGTEN
jgi:glycerol-3-phosphate acyltransferase PlsX